MIIRVTAREENTLKYLLKRLKARKQFKQRIAFKDIDFNNLITLKGKTIITDINDDCLQHNIFIYLLYQYRKLDINFIIPTTECFQVHHIINDSATHFLREYDHPPTESAFDRINYVMGSKYFEFVNMANGDKTYFYKREDN